MKHSSFAGLIGVAREDITPPVGIFCRNWGAAKHDAATGIHRPLALTALTLQESAPSKPLVLIDTDLGWFADLRFARRFLGHLRDSLGLSPERLIFGMSHTHSAPPLLVEAEPEWEGRELLAPYTEQVHDAAVRAVKNALAQAQPATLEWHTGHCTLASNRDLPEGKRIIVGYNPAKPADDTLLVGRISRPDGSILATLANYACHPTTLAWENALISPDYVGAMRETVERHTENAPALFLQGASGELAPRHQYVGDPAVADRHGRQLGFAVLATLADMNPPGHALVYAGVVESGAPLAAWQQVPCVSSRELRAVVWPVELPLKQWPKAEELAQQFRDCQDRAMAERIRRKLKIRRCLGDGPHFPLELVAWQIGDAVLCGTMAEPYSAMQQRLRKAFPERSVVWMNLINGSLGYLPPADLYDQDQYGVWQTPIERGGLEQFAAAAEQLIAGWLGAQKQTSLSG